ncbi:RodZ domain-containing protein [Psychromonas hadalis]|uniref:RodZ domain-containing protein n=1 Tax=Psychromonas hadalis TaxID=211669 RepID=UPI0003B65E49|nr:RodZ domain-containing protein [Psychromonas hadalis]
MKTESHESPEIIVPLGQALKDARLVISLSIDEVADQLNLSVTTVCDLEDNLQNVLKTKKYPVIYLRGYLVNYAKLVGLNTLELFVEYQQLESSRKEKKNLHSLGLIPETKKRTKRLPLILLVIIVLVSLFYLFQKQLLANFTSIFESVSEVVSKEGESEKQLLNITPSSSITDDVVIQALKNQQQIELINTEPKKQTIVTLPQAKNVTIEQDNVLEKEIIERETPVIEEAVMKTESIEKIVLENEAVVAVSFDAFAATTEVTEPEVVEEALDLPISPESLTLAFTAECWTEVFDASGKRIAFGLYKKGRVLMLSGLSPFQLKLGDPSVVEIQYNDEIIEGDFAPGRSVNFTIPLS